MKYTKPSIKFNSFIQNETVADYTGEDMKISGLELNYDIGPDNEIW